jgi:hypothetical protein
MRRRDGDTAKHGHCALAMLLNRSRSWGTRTYLPPAKRSASLASFLAPDFLTARTPSAIGSCFGPETT